MASEPLIVQLGERGHYLAFGRLGWAFLGLNDPCLLAWVQIQRWGSSRRLIVGNVVVEKIPAVAGLSGRDLAKMRLGLIETAVNSPAHIDAIMNLLPASGDEAGAAMVGTRIAKELAPVHAAPGVARRSKLDLAYSGPTKRPDEFYRRVAELHSEVSGLSRKPAIDIARANGVPPSTVYRWLKEARRRGILPPRRASSQEGMS